MSKVSQAGTEGLIEFWAQEIPHQFRLSEYSYNMTIELFKDFFDLEDLQGKRVLDLGAGYGQPLKYLSELGAEGYSLDIVMENAKFCSVFSESTCGDVRYAPYLDKSFDYVYSLGVIEHFDDTERAVSEHLRLLRPGGKALIVVPNRFSPYALSFLYHRFRGNPQTIAAIGKRFLRDDLADMVSSAGFSDVVVKACYGHAALRLLPLAYSGALAKIMNTLTVGCLFGHWLACTAERPDVE